MLEKHLPHCGVAGSCKSGTSIYGLWLMFLLLPHLGSAAVGLFVSSAHKLTAISLPTQTSFEAISGKLECGQSCLIILNIYRPPGPATAFFSELQDILSYISTLPHDVALMEDFILRIDSSSSDAGRLSGIWTLSTSTNTLTFLPTFTVILSTL